ncbi:hypothetical protein GLYMA_14G061250v4 [Glycine max]|nr:hypothetical protein GLYMA_14G061250v4 [Glycine max]KAH1093287.1 hypothetical protein GYH30_039165 [Glycine max]
MIFIDWWIIRTGSSSLWVCALQDFYTIQKVDLDHLTCSSSLAEIDAKY